MKNKKENKVLVVFTVISALCCIIAFRNYSILAGLIGIVMTVFFIYALLINKEIIREPFRSAKLLIMIAAFAMFIPYIFFADHANSVKDIEKINWTTDIEMNQMLPEPKSNLCEVSLNSDKYLTLYVHKMQKNDYTQYVQDCEALGYIIDSDKSEISYSAYNDKGYKVMLSYYESDQKMYISLDGPKKMGEIQFPTNGLGALLPVPESNIGNIELDSSECMIIYMENTPLEDYNSYVSACSNNGFNIDYYKNDKHYSAKDSNNNELILEYRGYNIMYINLTASNSNNSDTKKENPIQASPSANNQTSTPSSTPTPTSSPTSAPTEIPIDDKARSVYNDAIGKRAYAVRADLESLGYTAKFTHDVTNMDFSEEVLPEDSEFYVPYIIVRLKEYNSSNKTASFYINTQENTDRQNEQRELKSNLNSKLNSTYAWQAVEKYGKEQYSYGFKLHYIAGILAEEAVDQDTWFLKAYCDVTNGYGTKAKNLTCEAHVTGTTDNPKIVDFVVY